MDFSESGNWQDSIPKWARYLIGIGQNWPSGDSSHRRIAIVSMPCDSSAAGLITLGAMTSDLCDPQANDSAGHYDSMLRYANQFLNNCRSCPELECNPSVVGCGYIAKASGRLRSIDSPNKKFAISEKTDINQKRLWWDLPGKGQNGAIQSFLNEDKATQYYADGMHPVSVGASVTSLDANIYRSLIGNRDPFDQNLDSSYSGLCLAGRVMGKRSTFDMLSNIEFAANGTPKSLSELLSISDWSAQNSVSRTMFYNSRTESLDRLTGSPRLVVADGDQSLLRVLNNPGFQTADIIGVVDRTIDRDRLDGISSKLSTLRQWYGIDEEVVACLPEKIRGADIGVISKRLSV